MKKTIVSLVLIACVGLVFAMKDNENSLVKQEPKTESVEITSPNVAWAVYELTYSEAAAGVGGTGTAIAVDRAIRGAKWGARIGKYAGAWGALGGAVVGAL